MQLIGEHVVTHIFPDTYSSLWEKLVELGELPHANLASDRTTYRRALQLARYVP